MIDHSHQRPLRSCTGAATAILVFAALMAACGGDDSVVGGSGGSSGNAGSSTTGGKDGATDSSVDARSDGDSSGSGGSGQAGADGSKADVTSPDVLDGGGGQDVGPADGPPSDGPASEAEAGRPPITMTGYQHAADVAWCSRMAECCTNNFDTNRCITYWDANFGVEYIAAYLQQYKGNFTGVNAVFDPVQAQQCVDLLRDLDCGSQTGATKRLIASTCLAAVQGTGAGSCRTSMECTSGRYCNLAPDGGPGTCVPLKTQGQACADPTFNGDQCSYLGAGIPNLYCKPLGGPGTCEPGEAVLTGCFSNQSCASYLCSSVNSTCVGAAAFTAKFCTVFAAPDGG